MTSELSKRSLGTSFSKGKSPYQLPSPSTNNICSVTSRKKQKKKNLSCKS